MKKKTAKKQAAATKPADEDEQARAEEPEPAKPADDEPTQGDDDNDRDNDDDNDRDDDNDARKSKPARAKARRAAEGAPSVAAPRSRLTIGVVILVILAIAGAGIFFWKSRQPEPLPTPPPRAELLDSVPANPMLLVTVDLDALRASPLGGLLKGNKQPAVMGQVKATCGFEPLDMLREVALVIPSTAGDADFGIVATGEKDPTPLLDCAKKVISARGGEPISSNLGTFRTVRDSGSRAGEIAARPSGPLLLGAGDFLRSMVDAADGAVPSAKTDAAHTALRAAVADATLARASVVLSAKQRATIADEVTRSGGKAPPALTHVLAAALGVKVSSETVQVHVVVLTDDEAASKDLTVAFDEVRQTRADDPILRLLGLGQLFDRIRIEADGKQLHAHLEMTISEAEVLFDRLSALRDMQGGAAAPSPSPIPRPSASPSALPSPSSGADHHKH